MNTKESIATYLTSLQGLNDLKERRHRAYLDRSMTGVKLERFLILGRFVLTEDGGMYPCLGNSLDPIPKEVCPDIPDVLTLSEAYQWLAEHGQEDRLSFAYTRCIPPVSIRCPVCGKGWDASNAHDVVISESSHTFNGDAFIGKTIGDLKNLHANAQNGEYLIAMGLAVRNDRFIDLTPDPWYVKHYPADATKHPTNAKGWRSRSDGFDDSYVIQSGDEIPYTLLTWEHRECSKKRLDAEQRLEFEEAFAAAGIDVRGMVAIPNEYCQCEKCASWYLVETNFGVLKLGWRKHVINLDWEKTGRKFLPIFESENSTKSDHYIHCWGVEKLVGYLKLMKDHVLVQDNPEVYIGHVPEEKVVK